MVCVGANFDFRWIPEIVVGWLCKKYVKDDLFLYIQNCNYLLSKMLLCPYVAPMEALIVQWQGQVLEFRGYRPCHLQRFVDQMQEDGWRNQLHFVDMGPCCRAMPDDARLSCSQPLIGSLTGFSYLSSSWIVTGVVPGYSWIDANGAAVGDRSRRFMYYMVSYLRLRLAEPFPASVAFWSRSWSSIVFMKLLIGGDLPIYRSSVSNLPIIEQGAVVALVPRGSVGP